jgi:ABC-type Na+ efflux pump permease subunit
MSAPEPTPSGNERGSRGARLRGMDPTEWLVVFLISGPAVVLCGLLLPGWLWFTLGVAWSILPLVLLCRALAWLVGPVFAYEMVRTLRRPRHILYRFLYGAALLLVLSWVYWNWQTELADRTADAVDPAAEMPRFAGQFYGAALATQVGAVLLLTPLFVAGTIAGEKERRTLDFLLASPLSNREIVAGKVAAQVTNLGFLVATTLPILALTQLWGGIDPLSVLIGFALTAATAVLVAGVAAYTSVLCPRATHAILATYLATVALAGLIGCVAAWCMVVPLFTGGSKLGFFFLAGVEVILGGFFIAAAADRVRRAASGTPEDPRPRKPLNPRPEPTPLPRGPSRPPVTDQPLLWKELSDRRIWWQEPRNFRDVLMLVVTLVLGWMTSVTILFSAAALDARLVSGQQYPFDELTGWVRVVSLILSCPLGLVVGLSAAARVTREREQRTLDSLLTIPDESSKILFAKWLGAVLSIRHMAFCLAVVWFWGLVTAGLHLLSLPLVVLTGVVYIAFAASLGLFFSVVCRGTVQATLATLLALLGLAVGTWVLKNNSHALLTSWLGAEAGGAVEVFVRYGLPFPMGLLDLTFGYDIDLGASVPFGDHGRIDTWQMIGAGLTGLGVYAGAAWLLWHAALVRFRAQTCRAPVRRKQAFEPVV